MQLKKRARSAKFGKKIEATEGTEEKNPQIIDSGSGKEELAVNNEQMTTSPQGIESKNQSVEQEKEEPIVKVENNEKEVISKVIHNEPGAVIEKNNDQVNQEEPTVKEDVGTVTTKNEEALNESPASENAYIIQTEVRKNLLRYFLVIAIISFLVGLVSMAVISSFLAKTTFEIPFITRKAAVVIPSPKSTITVEPTKLTEVDLIAYNIGLLNGSGITGAAAKLKTALTKDGFKVISAGNADKSDYTDTIVSAKKKVNLAYLEKLKEYLKKTYILAHDSITPVPEDSEADVIITIGSNILGN